MRVKLLILGFVFIAVPRVFCQLRMDTTQNDDGLTEENYMYAFTQATKLYIFGDIGNALNLYEECYKYKPQSPTLNYQMAQIYMKAGNFNSAKAYAKKAHAIDPGNRWFTLQLANVYKGLNIIDSAIYVYRELLDGSDRDIGTYYTLANLYTKEKRYPDALACLNKIEERIGISQEVSIAKADIFSKMGDNKKAISQLRKTLNGGENDYIIYGVMAENFRMHHRADSAQFYYNLILPKHENDANVVLSYGEFLLERKRVDEARKVYKAFAMNPRIDENIKYQYFYQAMQNQQIYNELKPVMRAAIDAMITEDKSDVKALALLSDMEYKDQQYKNAAFDLRKIIKLDEGNYAAWEQLLFCKNALNQQDSIIFYGKQVISNFPERPLPYLLLGSAYYVKKNYDDAIGNLERGINYVQNKALMIEFYSMLAESYGRKDNYIMSDKYYNEALGIDSLNLPILNNYAYSLAERNEQLKKAEEMSQYTIIIEPKNGTYLDTYAWILYKENRWKEAKEIESKALKYDGSKNGEVLGHYGDILLKLNKRNAAKKWWNEAIRFTDDEGLKKGLEDKIKGLKN